MVKRLISLTLALLLVLNLLISTALAASATITLPSSGGTVTKQVSAAANTVTQVAVVVQTEGWYQINISNNDKGDSYMTGNLYDARGRRIGLEQRSSICRQTDVYLEAGKYTLEFDKTYSNKTSSLTVKVSGLIYDILAVGDSGTYHGEMIANDDPIGSIHDYAYIIFTPQESAYYKFSYNSEHQCIVYDSSYTFISDSDTMRLEAGEMYYLCMGSITYGAFSGTVSVAKVQFNNLTPSQPLRLSLTYSNAVESTEDIATLEVPTSGRYRLMMTYTGTGDKFYYPPDFSIGSELKLSVLDSGGNEMASVWNTSDFENLYQRTLELWLDQGETYTVSIGTYYLGQSGWLDVQVQQTGMGVSVPVREENSNAVLDNAIAGLNLDELVPDIDFGMDKLKGPQITIAGHTFNLFEIEGNVKIPLSKKLTIQVQADTEKKTVNILLGYKTKSGSTTVVGDPNSQEEDLDYWESYTDAKELYKLVLGGKTNTPDFRSKFNQQYDKLQKFQMDMIVKASARLSGFIEFSYESGSLELSEGGGVLGVELSKTLNGRIPSFPAAYLTIRFKAKTEGGIAAYVDQAEVIWEPRFDASLSAAIGVGLGKNTGFFQSYVEGGFEGEIGVSARPLHIATNEDPLTVDMTGSLYLKLKLLVIETTLRQELFHFGLFPRLELLSEQQLLELSLADLMANAQPTPRDYLYFPSTFAVTDDYSYYQGSIYPYAEPNLVSLPGGKLLMVWVGDTGIKADNDRTSILYSVYSDGKWSDPEIVCENGFYNDHPTLAVGEDGIAHLVWMRANTSFQDNWTAEEMLSHLELCATYYNSATGAWVNPTVLSSNNSLAKQAQVMAVGEGDVAVAWVENSENDPMMSSGTNKVWLRRMIDGEWTAEPEELYSTTYDVTSLAFSVDSTGWEGYCVVYNGSYSIAIDLQNVGSGTRAESVSMVHGHKYSIRDGQLYEDDTATGLSGINNYNILISGERKAALTLVPTGLTCELYGSYYDMGTNTWGDWVQLTGYNKYIRDYSACFDDTGRLTVALNLVDVVETADGAEYGNATLAVAIDPKYTDLAVEDAVIYDDVLVTPGGSLPLTVRVTNNSSATLTSLPMTVEGAKGTQSFTPNCSIAPGDTADVTVNYILPADLTEHTVTVTVTPQVGEADSSNNSATVTVGCADLSVEAGEPKLGSRGPFVTVIVRNVGFSTATNAVLTVYDANLAGDTVTELKLGDLEPGAAVELSISLPNNYLLLNNLDSMYALQYELVCDSTERLLSNNSVRTVFNGVLPWQAGGSLDASGNLNVELNLQPETDGLFILAVYRGNQMVASSAVQISGQTQSFLTANLTQYPYPVTAKVFWLDPVTNAPRSICWSQSFDVEQ